MQSNGIEGLLVETHSWAPAALTERYFAERGDGLRPAASEQLSIATA